ncbi:MULTISPECIES: LPS export ABC transporter permease LptF [unclassified Massilia]|uniref:LPS export ABC transporter permease LptF n=1 Tax=unclassified Massilia TaxID=2609279 RepID=UPI00178701C9|nr:MULTISPECIES: LPS export ABC transporter permease LptF [unclassified Massilia]MBD8531211.1 LPS export ABC transporter permease LptF [Massilia sp. CFBP 13647]MBD8676526.1 LPS export ABC transporter permease LptF [Massilia sp. CFBP 13721]
MIFHRALHRELASAAGATFTVLFTVCVTWTLIAILGRAAGGRVASGDVVALIAFQSLNYLPTVLILTSFISVLVAVTRSYRDSEMVVWFASGQSLLAWIRPVLTFGIPLVLLVGAVSLVVAPWAKMKSAEFIQRFEKREDLKRVAPGQFRESSSADRVFFVEGSANGSTVVQNVFVSTNQANGGSSVVVAREGVIEADGKGGQYLVLKNGRRYQGVPGQADFQSMEFERYSMRVATSVPVLGADVPLDALSTPALLAVNNQYTRSELLSRISQPIVCFVLILLAIPLGFVNPRAGSSANLILALLIFFTYNNLVKMVEASVKKERLDFALAWWPLHLVVGLIVVGLFAWRLNVNHHYHPLVLINAWKRKRLLKKAPVSTQAQVESR